ncbi:hypothetical protein F2Q68_00034029 [Brassica cretica]|uniref:Uncharacterized protein n=1 Tax=Brassica cretica TaxID=69181 RepID=A0A8S9H7W3_BRACR|nr:hypothetical protein F2Q68_00034029 [Brassica cretica]
MSLFEQGECEGQITISCMTITPAQGPINTLQQARKFSVSAPSIDKEVLTSIDDRDRRTVKFKSGAGTNADLQPNLTQLLVMGLGIHGIRFFKQVWKVSIKPTRFVDPDVIRWLGIREDLKDMFVELGMGNMATNPHVLYPELVRQFMATVQVYYNRERARRASEVPRRYTVQRAGGPQQEQPEAALSPLPPMPDMSTRPEGDFQRVVVDAFTAIWVRVSRCRCSSRASVRARSPSRQCRGDSEETTDETTDED